MAVEGTTPVTAIEGIGTATAAALATVQVFNVFDLLRVPLMTLQGATSALASPEEARTWKQMACFLQVAEVTPQWAEALVRAGIQTIDELCGNSIAEIETLMHAARNDGIIPQMPDTMQISDMLRDASVLAHTGCFNGTVLDRQGQPINGAVAVMGGAHVESDSQGRFRMLRIRLGRPNTLRISRAGFQPLVLVNPQVLPEIDMIGGQVYRLEAVNGTAAAETVLSELIGDGLPQSHTRVREMVLPAAELRRDDILLAREFYSSADVLLVSYFKSWSGGELFVHTFRVPMSHFPGPVELRQQFRFSDQGLIPVNMSRVELHRCKVSLRIQKAFAARPKATSLQALAVELKDKVNALLENGFFALKKEE